MEFTKERTNIAKGVAICLMFAHHLYAFNYRLLNGNSYIPVVPFIDIESYIGKFGNICVSMFLFLSAYGMYLGYLRSNKKTALHYALLKLKNFYLTYWLYFIIFVPIGIFFLRDVTFWDSNRVHYSAEPITILRNFIGWDSTYNAEWWFIQMFVMILLILFPLYAELAKKDIILILFTSLILFYFSSKVNPWGKYGFIFWQTSFAVGIVCSKLKFFSSSLVQHLDKYKWFHIVCGLLLCFLLRFRFDGADYDFLITPVFIYFSIRLVESLRLSTIFSYLGKYSFPLWLIHSFFCYYYFQDFIYFPKYSLLVFILLTISSLLSVLAIEYLFSHLSYLTSPCTGQIEKLCLRFKNATVGNK